MNQQRGLWDADGGGSANWLSCFPTEFMQIKIAPQTSFAGLYAEATSVSMFPRHIRDNSIRHSSLGAFG